LGSKGQFYQSRTITGKAEEKKKEQFNWEVSLHLAGKRGKRGATSEWVKNKGRGDVLLRRGAQEGVLSGPLTKGAAVKKKKGGRLFLSKGIESCK